MKLHIAILTGLTFVTLHSGLQAQSTAFTYQGRLNEAGQPATGLYEFRFMLHDSVSNGATVGGSQTNGAVPVSNGLFSVTLDFGGGVFTGGNRWLEIAVRTNASSEPFVPLTPYQPITATPYAIHAANAAAVSSNSITALHLRAGPGTNGQMLKLAGGELSWAADSDSGGTVTSVNAGTGLTGGTITTSGTLAINTTVVPRLNAANTFTAGRQVIQTGGTLNEGLAIRGVLGQTAALQEWQNSVGVVVASVSPAGVFTGNGAGLAGLNANNLTSGTVGDSRLPSNVARTNQVWLRSGNVGITAADFIGTTDDQALELRVNNTRALRVEPHPVSPNLVGGFSDNFVAPGIFGSVISGGGGQNSLTQVENLLTNSVAANYGFVGGGAGNKIHGGSPDLSNDYGVINGGLRNEMTSSDQSVIGGGRGNLVKDSLSAVVAGGCVNVIVETSGNALIGGGWLNTIANGFYGMIGAGARNQVFTNSFSTIVNGSSNLVGHADYSTIVGGRNHKLYADYGFIGSGEGNIIDAFSPHSTIGGGSGHFINQQAPYATIPGGRQNSARASYAFAAGRRAKASHAGTFVWADSTDADFSSTDTNQFLIRAGGGMAINTNDPGASALNVNGTVTATAFAGPGAGLTGLDAGNFSSGTLPNARLSNNVAFLNTAQTFSAAKTFSADIMLGSGAQVFADAGAALAPGLAFDSDTGIYSPTANALALTTGGNERLRVTSSGNVGIGLNNPSAPLEVGFGAGQSLEFRYDDGLVPGINVSTTGGNAGVMRFRNSMEIWPSDDATRPGKLDLRATSGSPNIVMDGQSGNIMARELNVGFGHVLSGTNSSIPGGIRNVIGPSASATVIGGGEDNGIHNYWSTIGGGKQNTISAGNATIAGGIFNTIKTNAWFATIGGGTANMIQTNGQYATIPGGYDNFAAGHYSFAAGNRAHANHNGAFVWADSQSPDFTSTAVNEVSFRCNGGVRFTSGAAGGNQTVSWAPGGASWSFSSDRNLKEGIKAVDTKAVLEKVSRVSVAQWNYKDHPQQHIGPMAQDFHAQFRLNDNDTMLDSGDLHGVALAAIQGLNQKVEEKEARIRALEATVNELKQILLKKAAHNSLP